MTRGVLAVLVFLAAAACGGIERPKRTPGLLVLLDSPDPSERAWAVFELTRRRAPEAVPGLIRRLRDEDGGIRLYADRGLRELTGEDLGFRASAPDDEREAAVRRWETWWAARDASAVGDVVGDEGASSP